MKSFKTTIYFEAEMNSQVSAFTRELSNFLNESTCVKLAATVTNEISEMPPNSEQGEPKPLPTTGNKSEPTDITPKCHQCGSDNATIKLCLRCGKKYK